MKLPKLSVLGLLLALVALTDFACVKVCGATTHFKLTGSSLGWYYLLDTPEKKAAAETSFTKDFYTAKEKHNIRLYFCTDFDVSDFYVNSTGAFATLDYSCYYSVSKSTLMYYTQPTDLSNYVSSLTSADPLYKAIGFPTEIGFDSDYLYPGTLPTPSPPGVVNQTTSNQTVMISGDYNQWTSALKNKKLKPAIEHDLCSSLVHYGVRAQCVVNSMTPHTGDTTKMLPGNGNAGLTLQATITQEVTDPSFVPYATHGVCATLMSVNYSETSLVYNGGSAIGAETLKTVAVYADIPYSVLNCEYVCIISISIMIAALYLFLCAFIIALIAVKCYLINDFSIKDITLQEMNFLSL